MGEGGRCRISATLPRAWRGPGDGTLAFPPPLPLEDSMGEGGGWRSPRLCHFSRNGPQPGQKKIGSELHDKAIIFQTLY